MEENLKEFSELDLGGHETCFRADQGAGPDPVRAGGGLHRPRGEAAGGAGGEPQGRRGLPPVGEERHL